MNFLDPFSNPNFKKKRCTSILAPSDFRVACSSRRVRTPKFFPESSGRHHGHRKRGHVILPDYQGASDRSNRANIGYPGSELCSKYRVEGLDLDQTIKGQSRFQKQYLAHCHAWFLAFHVEPAVRLLGLSFVTPTIFFFVTDYQTWLRLQVVAHPGGCSWSCVPRGTQLIGWNKSYLEMLAGKIRFGISGRCQNW